MSTPSRADVIDACLDTFSSPVTRLRGNKHLVASRDGRGYAVIWDGPEACDLTEEVYEELVAEIQQNLPGYPIDRLTVFSRYNLFATDDVDWQQFPIEIMRALPAREVPEAPVTITSHHATVNVRLDVDVAGRTMDDGYGRAMVPNRVAAELTHSTDGVRLVHLTIEGDVVDFGGYGERFYGPHPGHSYACAVFYDPDAPEWLVAIARRIVTGTVGLDAIAA